MKIENIKVNVVDSEKLIKFMSIPLDENQELMIDKFAVYQDKFIISTDCCFGDIEKEYFIKQIQHVVRIDCRIKKIINDGSYTIRMDRPDFVKTISLNAFLCLSYEINLIDFIRYNYNPRISDNQKLLMKYIRDSQKLEPQH